MRHMKWLAPFVLLIAIVASLSACGTDWQKPTGLEATGNEQQEENIENDAENTLDHEENKTDDETDIDDEGNADNHNDEDNVADSEIEAEADAAHHDQEETTDHLESSDNKENATSTQTSKNKTDKANKTKKSSSSKNKKDKKSSSQSKSSNAQSKKADKSSSKSTSKSNAKKEQKKSNEKPTKKPKQDKQENTSPQKPEPEEPKKPTIVVSIVISSSEVPLSPTELEIEEGDTVMETLIAITKKHDVQMEYQGGQGAMAYVKGIGNVYEFDRGQGSGWMFRINGIFPNRGAGVIPLQDGDRVEWLYTTDLGEDLGADLEPFRR